MTKTVCVNAIIPFAADDMAIIEGEKMTMMNHSYFVVGRTISGGRHYSPTFGWDEVTERFREWKNLVKFFDGGTVTLYECTYDDYEPIYSEIVF